MNVTELQRLFHKEVEEQIKSSSEYLMGGGAEDHGQYLGLVGKLTGLKLAQTVIDQIINDWIRNQGEDE